MNRSKLIFSFSLICATLLNANADFQPHPSVVEKKQSEKKEESFELKTQSLLKKQINKKSSFLLTTKANLESYYQVNNMNMFWFDKNGIKDIALNLLDAIKNDPVLKPVSTETFRLDTVANSLNNLDKSPEKYFQNIIEIDFMLTEIFDKYIRYVSKGTINWGNFQKDLKELDDRSEIVADWEKYTLNVDTKKLLKEAVLNNDLKFAIDKVNFTYPKANELILAMNDLEKVASSGGYTRLPEFKSLRLGDYAKEVIVLRKRLTESNDLSKTCVQEVMAKEVVTNNINTNNSSENSAQVAQETPIERNCQEVFDEDLKEAVISFQKSHGLTPDGIVGYSTQRFLNMTAQEKIEQIRLNLERMRWLPRNLGEKYLVVNIPEYTLRMYDNGNIKLEMPVVVGETKHPTPIFSNEMSYIVLNPYWRIPKSIAQKELIPKLAKDPNYAAAKGIRILEQWDPNADEYDTSGVDWKEYMGYLNTLEAKRRNKIGGEIAVSEDILNLPNLKFVQVPSDDNPLGRIKFMFPNKHAVYMHDTPAKSLFGRTVRAFSHGCIRLARPKDLLKTISEYDTSLDYEKANEVLQNIEKKNIGLKEKIPVHIVYLTSWVDENGKLQFRDDIYKYDSMQKKYLY